MELNKTSSFDKKLNINLNNISMNNRPLNKKNKISLIKRKDKEERMNANLFLTQNNLSKRLEKIYKGKSKIKLIKNLLILFFSKIFY